MRCSASPTTSTAADGPATNVIAMKNAVSAILFREILKPLAGGLGPFGEIAIGSVADSVFVQPKR